MKKISLMLLFFSIFFVSAFAQQTRYIIKFKDKATNPFSLSNPAAYLSNRALQRRATYNILIDSTDLPVTPRYIDSIRLAGVVEILNASKWLNQITIRTTDAVALTKISNFSFVASTAAAASKLNEQGVPVNKMLPSIKEIEIPTENNFNLTGIEGNLSNYGRSSGQVKLHQGEFLHEHGFKGENMQISVLDGGFFRYLSLPTFDSVRNNNQIINVWDFVSNNSNVDEDDAHGMNCLSTIAANMPGVFVGTAPKANFCLYRTEDVFTETNIEEHNLAAGYEKADSIGVDVCTVSLGYTTFDYSNQNYTYASMNGKTSMSAIASNIAARKGMLPIIACGNEGARPWRYVSSPGDADSIMTVGAVDTLGVVGAFSSYGPTSNGRIKPNVAATGVRAVVASSSTGLPIYGNGTSYATPNIAGLTTCLWQAFPEYNNMAILDVMQKAASRYTSPNDRIGYGIPDMKKAFVLLLKKSYTQTISITNCIASIKLNVKFDNTMKVVLERKQSNEINYTSYKTINGTNNFTNKTISFADDLMQVSSGDVLYRIRLDIASDTSLYLDSLIIAAPINCTNPTNFVQLKENPITHIANLVVSRAAASKMSIAILNVTGQVIYEESYNQNAGAQIKIINMQKHAAGIYFIKVFANDKKIETIKLFKR